jgi:RNA-binding protein
MKRLGVVENLSYDGTVLIRSDFAPPLGVPVVDRKGGAVGTVEKVFGPVKQPFTALRPAGKPAMGLLGAEVFLSQGMTHGQQAHRGSRRDH